ncbi:hypothetical protein GGR57DRAFT_497561 [Xylariaceae sp. FL1272]|nr:hypothetical protein GGR57DRAFT_497561 [Xylariaceae sp. FL1272]
MSTALTLDDALVTNWGPYYHSNGTLRARVTVALDCQICSTPLAIDHAADDGHESYTVLLCGHALGVRCMRRWVAENPTCPICRKNLEHPGCEHVALPEFEQGAGYNVHDPPFGVVGPTDELNFLCVVCDGSVQVRDPSDQVPELEHYTSRANRQPSGELTTFLDPNSWQEPDIQPVHDYELQDTENTEEVMVQEIMSLSLRDQDATHSDHRRQNSGEVSTSHRDDHRHGHSRASSDSDEVGPVTPRPRNSELSSRHPHTQRDHRPHLRGYDPFYSPLLHPYAHGDGRDDFFARAGAHDQTRFHAELHRFAERNHSGTQYSHIRSHESRTRGHTRVRPGDLLYRDDDGDWWLGVRD